MAENCPNCDRLREALPKVRAEMVRRHEADLERRDEERVRLRAMLRLTETMLECSRPPQDGELRKRYVEALDQCRALEAEQPLPTPPEAKPC